MLSQYKNEENYSSNRIKEQFKDRKIDDLESERTKIISNEFLNFFDQIARGNRKYINDLYYLIQYRDGFPEKIFLEMDDSIIYDNEGNEKTIKEGFIYHIVKESIKEEPNILAILSLAELFICNSIEILHLIIKTTIPTPQGNTTFLFELPRLVQNARDPKVQSALFYIIATASTIENIQDTFYNFFVQAFQNPDPEFISVKEAAAKASLMIIQCKPTSDFSTNIMSEILFDLNNKVLVSCCFHAIAIQVEAGNFNCFEIPQMVRFLEDPRTSKYAAFVLYNASKVSEEISKELLNYTQEIVNAFFVINPKYLTSLVCNIVKNGETYALSFIPSFLVWEDLYYQVSAPDKIEIARVISLIITFSHVSYYDKLEGICRLLINSLELQDSNVSIVALDALYQLNFVDEEFHEALMNLKLSSDGIIAYHASMILNSMESQINGTNDV